MSSRETQGTHEKMGATMAQPPSPEGPVAAAEPAPATRASTTQAPVTVTLDDAGIAGMAEAITDHGLRLAQLGESKAASRRVRGFAHDVLTGDELLQSELKALCSKIGVSPSQDARSAEGRAASRWASGRLSTEAGGEFDRVYLAAQVREQSRARARLDEFATEARAPALRAQLVRMRDKVDVFCHVARSLQEDAEASGGGHRARGVTTAGPPGSPR